jgi:transcriptional regulator with XRE-family HTH domain
MKKGARGYKTPVRRAFGYRVRCVRESRLLSQVELSKIMNCHSSKISAIERGEKNVTLETMLKLAIALKCELAVLMPSNCAIYDMGYED